MNYEKLAYLYTLFPLNELQMCAFARDIWPEKLKIEVEQLLFFLGS
jgi:hypothetical protein